MEQPHVFPQAKLTSVWQSVRFQATDWADLDPWRGRDDWPQCVRLPALHAEPGANTALYRQTFDAAPLPTDGRCELEIGAAMVATRVWLNGVLLAEHWGGHTPFTVDLSDALTVGPNELVLGVRGEDAAFSAEGDAVHCPLGVSALMLDDIGRERWTRQFGLTEPCPRFGITEPVRLRVRPQRDIEDVFVQADASLTRLEIEVAHTLGDAGEWDVTLRDASGVVVATRQFPAEEAVPMAPALGDAAGASRVKLIWDSPPLLTWSPEQPRLYQLAVRAVGREPGAERTVRFGWRSFGVDGERFLLNGQPVMLRGESDLFQNQGYQFNDPHGLDIAALRSPEAVRSYLAGLKQALGINAIRQHAAIGSPAVFAAADEVGLLVLNQSAVWSRGHAFYVNGGERFIAQAAREFTAWVRRDRNHPSVVIWGVENEMMRVGSQDPEACAFFRRLEEPIAALDPQRLRTFDGGAAVLPELAIHHVHHEENYDVILRNWQRRTPLVFGEFWVGGRNAERRLTSGVEYASAAEFWTEMNRLWVRRIVELRRGGASGVMPYNFTPQLLASTERRRQVDGARTESWLGAAGLDFLPGVAAQFRHALGACMVTFDTNREAFYADELGRVSIPVLVRNDSEQRQCLDLRASVEGRRVDRQNVTLPPGEAWQGNVVWAVDAPEGRVSVQLTLGTEEDGEVDRCARRIHWCTPETTRWTLSRRVFATDDAAVGPYEENLLARGVAVERWALADGLAVLRGALLIAPPAIVAEIGRRQPELEVSGWVVEAVGDYPAWLGTGGIFDFGGPYLHTNHFEEVMGRPVTVGDLYHPTEVMVEDGDHPVLARWPERRLSALFDHDDVIAHGVIVHPGMTLQNIKGDMRNVGAGMNLGEESEHGDVGSADVRFRPLLSSSRREYASLAEMTVGRGRWLVNRLRVGEALGHHPWADTLWADGLRWLEGPGPGEASAGRRTWVWNAASEAFDEEQWAVASTVVVHQLDQASTEVFATLNRTVGAVRRFAPAVPANHVAVEHGGVFAASKSASLLEETLPFGQALGWDEAPAVIGAWRLLRLDESFEVKGPAFPWTWRSDYPQLVGYAGLHLYRHGKDIVLLLEDATADDPAVRSRYRMVWDNVQRLEAARV